MLIKLLCSVIDITSVRIKYQEGFSVVPIAPGVTEIMGTPEQMWSKSDQNLVIPSMFSI